MEISFYLTKLVEEHIVRLKDQVENMPFGDVLGLARRIRKRAYEVTGCAERLGD